MDITAALICATTPVTMFVLIALLFVLYSVPLNCLYDCVYILMGALSKADGHRYQLRKLLDPDV